MAPELLLVMSLAASIFSEVHPPVIKIS